MYVLPVATPPVLMLLVLLLLPPTPMQDGTSNWLKGAMLVLTYLFVAAGFWVHKDPSLRTDASIN